MVRPKFSGEPIDEMLRRLKRQLDLDGVMATLRAHRHFTPRGEARRTKSSKARRRRSGK